ncbi:hypothetical protein [Pseudomonas fildesensis]|uniref:Uncharacterized protein n=1 Tax=Pseudomonas fildesensis TaxID=1674920 RepID=A0A0J8G843_9PSED|nr:hypothetical protein [Pseudomonas fildesensis]KMT57004.1 hypothetical protein ACR52_05335 [Pseudomonas fildesensis]
MDIAGYKFITVLVRVEFFISLALLLYSHYFKLEKLEKYFEKNEIVQLNKRRWPGKRPMDKAMRMGQIGLFLIFPKSYIRLGDVSSEELASVPVSLKRWATWPDYFVIQMFVWVGVSYVLYGR